MTRDTFNRSLDFNSKLKYFLACYLLVWVVLQDAIGKFLIILNNREVINIYKGFDPAALFWTDQPLWNIVKLAIICVLAFMFGVAYSYMARKIRKSEKVTISMFNAISGVFGYLLISFAIVAIFKNDTLHYSFMYIREAFKQNNFFVIFIALQVIGVGVLTYVGINTGQMLIDKLNEDEKGRLLGVKWYHYIWLSPAISIYIQSFLYLAYMTVRAIGIFFKNFKWDEVSEGAARSGGSNSINSLVWGIFFIYLIAVVIFYLIMLQRDILANKVKMHAVFKVLISISVSAIIPILLAMFTVIGYNH